MSGVWLHHVRCSLTGSSDRCNRDCEQLSLEVRKSLTILGDPIFYGGTLRSCITVPHQKTESLTILGDPAVCGGTLRSYITAVP